MRNSCIHNISAITALLAALMLSLGYSANSYAEISDESLPQQDCKKASQYVAELGIRRFKGEEFGHPELKFIGDVKEITVLNIGGAKKYVFDKQGRLLRKLSNIGSVLIEDIVYRYSNNRLIASEEMDENGLIKGKTTFHYDSKNLLKKTIREHQGTSPISTSYSYGACGKVQTVTLISDEVPPENYIISSETGDVVSNSNYPLTLSLTERRNYFSPSVVRSDFACAPHQSSDFERCLHTKTERAKRSVAAIVVRDKEKQLPVATWMALHDRVYLTQDIKYEFDRLGNWINMKIAYGRIKINDDGTPGNKQTTEHSEVRREILYFNHEY